MSFINIDRELCIKCGLCAQDCPTEAIMMTDDGPEVVSEVCIRCGHCVAVCPKAALDNIYTPLKNQIPFDDAKEINKDQASYFLKKRRSIRKFKNMPVPHQAIEELIDTARYAQTGGNSQGVSFKVIDNEATINKIIVALNTWAEEESIKQTPYSSYLKEMSEKYKNTGNDRFLKGTPCILLSLVDKKTAVMRRENGRFALIYAELFAPYLDLGTCWAGFFEMAVRSSKVVSDLLGLPKDMELSGALMIGYPKYRHRRIVDRAKTSIIWEE